MNQVIISFTNTHESSKSTTLILKEDDLRHDKLVEQGIRQLKEKLQNKNPQGRVKIEIQK